MRIGELSGKKVCILGFGREGQATLRMLEKHAPTAKITIADRNLELQATSHELQAGPDYLKNLSRFDFIIKSPGIPPQPELDAIRKKITSGTQIFLDSIKDTGAIVIGVTGSKGKSTTSTLIYELLKAGGKRVFLIGNIGKPSIEYIDEAKKDVYFVLEMSSYQLMDLTVSPHIAVVTSFFPEHLDYHGSLEAYKEAKKHIARFQTKDDLIFFNGTSDGAKEIARESHGTVVPFAGDECPVPIFKTHLLGEHNRSNIAGAYKVAQHLGVPSDICIDVIKAFKGLPHRLQSIGIHHGIEWIDDAISTTPESTIAALDALGAGVRTIILGGQDRGNDFTELGKRIISSSIKNVILFPGSGPRIRQAIIDAMMLASQPDQWVAFYDAPDMPTAVSMANKATGHPSATLRAGEPPATGHPICLLSTASPSYGMFKNFEEKGEKFKESISMSH